MRTFFYDFYFLRYWIHFEKLHCLCMDILTLSKRCMVDYLLHRIIICDNASLVVEA